MEKLIFYRPIELSKNEKSQSGSNIRPLSMRNAFYELGYNVIEINGCFKSRRETLARALRKSEKKEIHFMYVESANIPFALSNIHHFPIRLFSDIVNFRRARKRIKIGFFYRDMHWASKEYEKEVGFLKAKILRVLFRFELILLYKVVDAIFVPSKNFATKLFIYEKAKSKFYILPPGFDKPIYNNFLDDKIPFSQLNILYSGNININSIYNLSTVINALSIVKIKINLQINTDIESNTASIDAYTKILKGKTLNCTFTNYEYNEKIDGFYHFGLIWQNADLSDAEIYMPIKLFSYIKMSIPIIGLADTAYGDFILENNIGWVYKNTQELIDLVNLLFENPELLNEKQNNVLKIQRDHFWLNRALFVQQILSSENGESTT